MSVSIQPKKELEEQGFVIVHNIYANNEINALIQVLKSLDSENENFRKNKDIFAIRQFLQEVPEIQNLIFNNTLKHLVNTYFGDDYFVVKSIYFDKPPSSNWFVPYHQDVSISVNKRELISGYTNWTVKKNQFGVQPPLDISKNIYTIRIHLDDTDKNNGALKVIPRSHSKGIYRVENIDWNSEKEVICNVPKGGVMLMKPLLIHSSSRTTNLQKRRVIHIEFSNKQLANNLDWAERIHR